MTTVVSQLCFFVVPSIAFYVMNEFSLFLIPTINSITQVNYEKNNISILIICRFR